MTLSTLSGRRASQNEYELRELIDLMLRYNVRNYCEIGAREGDTFVEVMRALPKAATGLAVDWPGALWGKSGTHKGLLAAVDMLKHDGYGVAHILGDSTKPATISAVELLGPFDCILIDGDHTYAGVKADWENYRGMAARMVAFHDIVGTGQAEKVYNNPVEVPKLWREIVAEGWPTCEIVAPGSSMGIGVVWTRRIGDEGDHG